MIEKVITPTIIEPIEEDTPIKVEESYCSFIFHCKRCKMDHTYYLSYFNVFPIFCLNCNTLLIFN